MRQDMQGIRGMLVVAWLTGCASMLPETHTNTASFQRFDEARAALEALEPQDDCKALETMALRRPIIPI
ncbi:hypothetical protein [Rhodoferax sp. BAB1]|uniref:hypothetical protein n=1 Tax=Rhodoferax sp. BAB1 TaxID=2741720 RepID=UPI001575E7EA|nr:hypothetical protein [Rhodoferax sp. BAB1]QKO20627.1 hypothetical protein HTY51_01365 [Rhodoferax sp. BAB1]